MDRDLINKSQDVLDGTRQDGIDLQEISLGKIVSTVLLTRLMGQLKKSTITSPIIRQIPITQFTQLFIGNSIFFFLSIRIKRFMVLTYSS